MLFYSAVNSAFVASGAHFVFKSVFFTRLEILDLFSNSFCFIFISNMSDNQK